MFNQGLDSNSSPLCKNQRSAHQILQALSSTAHIQQPPDSVIRVVVHDPGGWKGVGRLIGLM